MTVAQLLERDDFAKRFAAHEPISLSEMLYPLMQAYDSVAIEADIEIGGTDQLYNLLAGRDVMGQYGLEPQIVMTYPLLVRDRRGREDVEVAVGNTIGITDEPSDMFGKTMSIPDSALAQWWELLLGEAPPSGGEPMTAKLELARRSSSPAGTATRQRSQRRPTSPASCGRVGRPRRCPRSPFRPATRSTCRPCSPRPLASRRARCGG